MNNNTSKLLVFQSLCCNRVFLLLQASVRLTLATLLYSGKSPDGHHILVNTSPTLSRSSNHCALLHRLLFSFLQIFLCVCVISEQCQVPSQGAACADRASHQGLPQSALHHRLQPHHSSSGKNSILKKLLD